MREFLITDVRARMVYNCNYIPSVEAVIEVNHKYTGWAISPKGQSTGSGEAREVLDGGEWLDGYGCSKAVENINTEIRSALLGLDATNQRRLDCRMIELDGTPDKSRLGGNAIVAVSAAAVKAAAAAVGLPVYRYLNNHSHILPVPMFSLMEGAHYGFGYASEIQEFNLFPIGADSEKEAIEICRKVHFKLGDILEKVYNPFVRLATAGGGYAIPEKVGAKNFDYIMDAIEQCGYVDKIKLGMDCAATHFYNKETGLYFFEGRERTPEEMLAYWKKLVTDYPILTMEDPFDEDDVDSFVKITEELPQIQIVGDDFFVTNPVRLKERIPRKAASALLWKYNQVGTITEAIDAAEVARSNGMGVQTSERSGENEDTLYSDLTVALDAGQTKTGCMFRAEHTAKYNRFLQIEAELGSNAVYAGSFFKQPYMKP